MVFRVTPQHYAANTIRYSQIHTQNLAKFQAQISTGLRVSKPSDDPSGMGSLLANKAAVSRIDVDLSNIGIARSKLNQSVAQLISAKEALSRANSLALEGIQSEESERRTFAQEVDGVLQLMLQIANSTDGGKPLYAGTAQTLEAFTISSRNAEGYIAGVEYHGTEERSRVVVGVLKAVDVLYSGTEVFLARGRAQTLLLGSSGATAGSGTASATGFGQLQVRHTSTTIAGASGLQPGSSTAADTILGPHTLTIDGTAMTMALDGGSPVTFAIGDPNVKVTAPSGAVVHLDTSGFVGGFSGDVQLQGEGTLSIDGGATTVPIDYSANQALLDSVTGAVTYIDSRNIEQTDDEPIEYQATSDVFSALIQLRDDLLNTRNLTGTDWKDAMSRRIGDIQRVHDQILEVVGEQSVALENLDGLQARAEDYQLETQHAVASQESTDVAAAVVEMQSEQNLLQFTYAVSAQLMTVSLLDFLQ